MILLYEKGEKPNILTHKVGEECYNIVDKKTYILDKFGEMHTITLAPDTSQGWPTTPYTMKNKLINGQFNIWQRSNYVSSPLQGYNAADRWATRAESLVGGSLVVARNISSDRTAMYMTHTNATSSMYTYQRIEDLTLKGKEITISFKWFGDSEVDFSIQLSLVENNISVLSNAVLVTNIQGVDNYVTATLTIPTSGTLITFGDYIELNIAYTSTGQDTITDGTYRIWDIQLEEGSVATPFEVRPTALELLLCQRYYWKDRLVGGGYDHQYSTGGLTQLSSGLAVFPTSMRMAPVVSTLTTPTYSNCSSQDIASISTGGFGTRVTVTSTGKYRAYGGLYDATAEL